MRCMKIREYSKGGGREAILPFESSVPGILIVPLVWRSLLILFCFGFFLCADSHLNINNKMSRTFFFFFL